jgi:hypothetical protein
MLSASPGQHHVMDLYLVIGNPNTRRASVIRSLSGCFNRSLRDIELLSGKATLKVYARVGSLQETRTRPADFVAEVVATRCNAVLCCVTPSESPTAPSLYPSALAYLDHFVAQGWSIRGVAALGQNSGGVRAQGLEHFPQAGVAPINVTAAAVRKHFGWR